MNWVGRSKNLAEQGMISCIYYARDIDKVRSAIALAYAAAHEGCYLLYVPGRGETSSSTGRITEFGNYHCSENFMKRTAGGHAMGTQESECMKSL